MNSFLETFGNKMMAKVLIKW